MNARIEHIRNLPENWDGYKAKPISEAACNQAERIVKLLQSEPIITPTAFGCIQLEFRDKNNRILLDIYENEIYCIIA